MNKIEQLIEKYTELDKAEQMVESGEVLNDLQSLQEPITIRHTKEEREAAEEELYDYMNEYWWA